MLGKGRESRKGLRFLRNAERAYEGKLERVGNTSIIKKRRNIHGECEVKDVNLKKGCREGVRSSEIIKKIRKLQRI